MKLGTDAFFGRLGMDSAIGAPGEFSGRTDSGPLAPPRSPAEVAAAAAKLKARTEGLARQQNVGDDEGPEHEAEDGDDPIDAILASVRQVLMKHRRPAVDTAAGPATAHDPLADATSLEEMRALAPLHSMDRAPRPWNGLSPQFSSVRNMRTV